MSKKSTFKGLLIGGLIGTTLTLLYAPQSGEETRRKLHDESIVLRDNALKSIQNVRESSLEAIKDTHMRIESSAKEITEAIREIRNIDQTDIVEEKIKQEQPVP